MATFKQPFWGQFGYFVVQQLVTVVVILICNNEAFHFNGLYYKTLFEGNQEIEKKFVQLSEHAPIC